MGGAKNLPRTASELILGRNAWARKEIQNEETYNKYGGCGEEIEIEAIGKTRRFNSNSICPNPRICLAHRRKICVYNQNKPISAGYGETDDYLGASRKLGARSA